MLTQILRELRTGDFASDTGDGQSQGTLLLELLALEVQMYREMGNMKKVKVGPFCQHRTPIKLRCASRMRSPIPVPWVSSARVAERCTCPRVRRAAHTENWEAAQVDFFQAFRSYDEAGSPLRIQVLKYLVLAHMLTGNDVNPFDSQETKPYREDPNIIAMTSLVDAYQRRDIQEAERIVEENHATLTEDEFISEFIADVLKELRIQYLIDVVRPYGSIQLATLSRVRNFC